MRELYLNYADEKQSENKHWFSQEVYKAEA